jgi:LAS superfamily LD-carboxypeptidase LdcB
VSQEQNDLYEIGRSKDGSIVTNAKGGSSVHNYGLAIDIIILDSTAPNGFTYDFDWDAVHKIAVSYGIEWGGTWTSFPDKPHFQQTFGYSTDELYSMYSSNLVDENGYVKMAR